MLLELLLLLLQKTPLPLAHHLQHQRPQHLQLLARNADLRLLMSLLRPEVLLELLLNLLHLLPGSNLVCFRPFYLIIKFITDMFGP